MMPSQEKRPELYLDCCPPGQCQGACWRGPDTVRGLRTAEHGSTLSPSWNPGQGGTKDPKMEWALRRKHLPEIL